MQRLDLWMLTNSGKKFKPYDVDRSMIDIYDIAHALGNTCRYGGHVDEFYSVAQHCVIMARDLFPLYLKSEGKEWKGLQNNEEALTVLLHDAAEAYIGDIPYPVKAGISDVIKPIENSILEKIYHLYGIAKYFDVEEGFPEYVDVLDIAILRVEKRDVVKDEDNEWRDLVEESWVPNNYTIDEVWSPEKATQEFLDVFEEIR